jgi:hypothetical protein
LSGETEKNYKNLTQESWCPTWDLNWTCSKYKSEALLIVEPINLMQIIESSFIGLKGVM